MGFSPKYLYYVVFFIFEKEKHFLFVHRGLQDKKSPRQTMSLLHSLLVHSFYDTVLSNEKHK
jgi:hypothetical protein